MSLQKAADRERQRERRQRGMRVDDSARQLALRQRDRAWRQRRAQAAEATR